MFEALNICPKTYYKYKNAADPDYEIYKSIRTIFKNSHYTYEYRRITIFLNKQKNSNQS